MEDDQQMPQIKIVLIGSPGAGKGTLSEWLIDRFDIPHISTGDVLRDHVDRSTKLGQRIENYMTKGQLVPDNLLRELVEDAVGQRVGYALDGYPRTIAQFYDLMEINPPDLVVYLKISDEIAIQRLMSRGRTDDTPEAIQSRLIEYASRTQPVLDEMKEFAYAQDAAFHLLEIDGSTDISNTRRLFVNQYTAISKRK